MLRTLRLAEKSQCKSTFRKLHLRWWHALAKTMQKLPGRAGIPEMVLQLIPPIVQTCGVCRDRAKPRSENVASIDLPDRLNDLQIDPMFVY